MSQQRPTPGRANVQEAAREAFNRMLDARTAEGIAKYGTPLQTWNGRDAHRDLAEELIDAIQYAKQAEMERADLETRLGLAEFVVGAAREWKGHAEEHTSWAHQYRDVIYKALAAYDALMALPVQFINYRKLYEQERAVCQSQDRRIADLVAENTRLAERLKTPSKEGET